MTEVTKLEPQTPAPQGDAMVSMIERVVLNPDADLDKLERMLAMKERMDAQTARIAFANALAEARSEIPPIIKDATVDFTSNKGRTHYRHETLAGIAKQIDPILSRHGLSYRFRTEQGQGGVRVTCIVQHAQGHSEETTLSGAPDQSGNKNGFQAVGSAVTYLQRYTLKAALGLSAEVDDDGQAAAPRPSEQPARKPPEQSREDDAAISPHAIEAAVTSLGSAETMASLQQIWRSIPTPIKADAKVAAAKDGRKAALQEQPPAQSAPEADEIPY